MDVQAGAGAKRGGRAHKSTGPIEPGIAKVEALAIGGHRILVGGHVLEEGTEKLAIRFGEEGRARGSGASRRPPCELSTESGEGRFYKLAGCLGLHSSVARACACVRIAWAHCLCHGTCESEGSDVDEEE